MNEWWRLMKRYIKPKRSQTHGQPSLNSLIIRTADLRTMTRFYERVIGLVRLQESQQRISLANSQSTLPLIWLDYLEEKDESAGNTLHHFGLKVASQSALIHMAHRLAEEKVPLTGSADNDYRTAIYCKDPDGHLIEIYWEKASMDTQTVPPRVFREGEWFEFPVQDLFTRKMSEEDFYDHGPQFEVAHLHYQVTRLQEESTSLFYQTVLKCQRLESLHAKSLKFVNQNSLICLTETYWRPETRASQSRILPLFFYPHLSDLSRISQALTKAQFEHQDEKGLILATDPHGFRCYLTTKDFFLRQEVEESYADH